MDVVAGRKKVGVEVFGTTTTVPSNCWARLMYYLYCVNYCLKDDGKDLVPSELRDYEKRYYSLSDEEKLTILALCSGPLLITNLTGKILFPVDELEEHNNKFLKITETTELVALGIRADRVVGIGGSSKEVTTIMLMTEQWANRNFFTALKEAIRSLERATVPAPSHKPYQPPAPSYRPKPTYRSPAIDNSSINSKLIFYDPSPNSSDNRCHEKVSECFDYLKMALPNVAIFLTVFSIIFFPVGITILGYLSYEIAPVYLDQRDALDASSYSSWPNNTHTASITLTGEENGYLKVYFDSSGVNQTANALAVSTTSPGQVDVSYVRGRYSWWDRQYKPQINGVTDLLSKDSFVYFRFSLGDTRSYSSFEVTLTGVHSTSGSTDWTTIQWVQQLWFYGLFSLGTLLVIPGCVIYCCCRHKE